MIAENRLMIRLARRYISRRLLQSVLFVVGVALGVAVGVAIDLANQSAKRAFNISAQSVAGRATHQIVGGPGGLPTELYQQTRLTLGIRTSAPVIDAYVRSPSLDDQLLRLLGVDPFAEAPFRSYLSTGEIESENQAAFDTLNLFLSQPGAVLLSEALAARYGLQPGDTITLRPNSTPVTVQVAGLLRPDDGISAQALDTLLLADIATAQEILDKPGILTRIDLILPDGYDLSRIEAVLPPGAALTTPNAANSALNQMTAAFELNLRALSLLALVVGGFLIYNTVTFSVVQRRSTIGIIRALGATRRQVFILILSEALLLGLVGTILGLALGIILGRTLVGLIAQTISDLYFAVNVTHITVPPSTLATGAVVGLTASIFAALIPSIEATRTPPAGTMTRSTIERGALRIVPYITGGAVVLILGGVVLLAIPSPIVVAFIALFMIVVGCAFFTPLVLVITMRAITPLTGRLLGVLGRMAPRDIVRSLSRTSVAVAALTVAVSVIVGIGIMISSFRGTVTDWLTLTLGADIFISPVSVTANRVTADLDPALIDRVAAVDGVETVTTVRNVDVLAPDYPDLPPVNLTVPSHDISFGRRRFAWNNSPDGDYWAALQNGMVLVSEPFAYRRGITPEHNTLTLLTDRGSRTFTVTGVYYDYGTDQGTVMMIDPVYRRLYDDPFITSLGVILEPGADLQRVIETLRTETLTGQDLNIRSNRALLESALDVFERTFTITVALQLLATLVAFIGILSALMSLQLEHTREYAVMRANGMTDRQLWGYTFIQTGLMGAVAGLLAAPIGLALALVLINVINVRSFGWTMQLALAPGEFLQAFLIALMAALAAGIYPAWRLGRLVLAEALRME